QKTGGSRHDPERIRYGCFLPDLTGLASAPSAPSPGADIGRNIGKCESGSPDIRQGARRSAGASPAFQRLRKLRHAGGAPALPEHEGPAPWSETGPSIVVCGRWTAHALFRREPPKKPRSSSAIGDNETLDHLLSNMC